MIKLLTFLKFISNDEISLLVFSIVVFIFWRIFKELTILLIIKKDKKIKSFRISHLGSIEVRKKSKKKKKKESKSET